MKKIVALFAFILTLSSQGKAQDFDPRLGFQLSPTFSFMRTDDNKINRNGTNLGLKLGAVGELYFEEKYALLIGIGFAFNTGGTLYHENFGDIWQRSELPQGVLRPFPAGTDLKYNLQYVEIPVGLKFKTREFGYIRYFTELPILTLGFNSQARGAIKYQGINEEKIDIKKEVTGLSLSWGLSAGIEYSVTESTAIVAGLGYQRVFTDVTKDYDGFDSKGTIGSIVLRLGVMF
jgi:opacity protein-like surface antigen